MCESGVRQSGEGAGNAGLGGAASTGAWDHLVTNAMGCSLVITTQGPMASQGTLPGPVGRSPVALVVHRHEVHEEHVVSHGVHAKELHLEGGEHAPGGGGVAGHLRWRRAGPAHLDQLREGWPPCWLLHLVTWPLHFISLHSAALTRLGCCLADGKMGSREVSCPFLKHRNG